MGHEPIADALDDGADIVLAGRATDTALIAAVALQRGMPAGPVWHAAKIAECGGLCTTNPRSGGVLVTIDADGFTVEPLDETAACTPTSVAAHMMYENADPFRMREPAGTLDTTDAVYTALDDRRVRVEGSRFEAADQHTIKLEGAAPAGYQTMIISGIRDPQVLARLDEWCDQLLAYLHDQHPRDVRPRRPATTTCAMLRYGHDAVLGAAEPCASSHHGRSASSSSPPPPIRPPPPSSPSSPTRSCSTPRCPATSPCPSFAFLGSPAETERGQIHEFVLQHAVDVTTPTELFRTVQRQSRRMTTTTRRTSPAQVRSKNAGPFWLTIDVFFDSDESYGRAARSALTDTEVLGALFATAARQGPRVPASPHLRGDQSVDAPPSNPRISSPTMTCTPVSSTSPSSTSPYRKPRQPVYKPREDPPAASPPELEEAAQTRVAAS